MKQFKQDNNKYSSVAFEPQGKDIQQLVQVLYAPYQDNYKGRKRWNYSKNDYNQEYVNYNSHYDKNHDRRGYAKNGKYYSADKNSGYSNATTASDSDSNGSNQNQDLIGFKIVVNGKTLHDDNNEDFEGIFEADKEEEKHISKEKFASSVMTITPQLHNISIPSFD